MISSRPTIVDASALATPIQPSRWRRLAGLCLLGAVATASTAPLWAQSVFNFKLLEQCLCGRHGPLKPGEAPPPPHDPVLAPAEPAAPTAPLVAMPDEIVDGYLRAGFDRLASYPLIATLETKPADVAAAIPEPIRKLDGRNVIVRGFMLPVKLEKGLVTEFLLMSSQQLCCYGVVPELNQWVVVRLARGVPPVQDVPLEFRGRLHVGPLVESDVLTGIYRLDGEAMPPGRG